MVKVSRFADEMKKVTLERHSGLYEQKLLCFVSMLVPVDWSN